MLEIQTSWHWMRNWCNTTKVEMKKRTWVSMKYWVGFFSYKCSCNLFLITSFWLGFTWTLKAHHAKTMALIFKTNMSTLFFHITNDHRKFPINHMDSLHQTTMVMFLKWTLSNRVFCFIEVMEPLFIKVVTIACFVNDITLLCGLFTSNKDCIIPNINSFYAWMHPSPCW